jgi:hypothetical protein
MPFRIHKNLRLTIEVVCEEQDLRKASDKEVAAILREAERCGDAMRSLNRRGKVIWKATQQLLDDIASAEAEADAEDVRM